MQRSTDSLAMTTATATATAMAMATSSRWARNAWLGGLTAALALTTSLGACSSGTSFKLGSDARLEFDPTSVVFSDVARGEVAYRVVTVRHVGTGGVIKLSPIKLVTDSPDLSLGVIEDTELSPGEETRIQIVYHSDHDEPDTGELIVGHNLAASRQTVIPISTPGQRASLVASPSVIDFGIAQAGTPRAVRVRVHNVGTAPATLTDWTMDEDEDRDFGLQYDQGLVIPAQGAAEIVATYQPSGRDRERGVAHIHTDRDDVSLTIQMEGEEETPILVVDPATIQLGWVEPGHQKVTEVKIKNEGNSPLDIDRVQLNALVPDLALSITDQAPLTLQPNDAIKVGVIYAPLDEQPMTGDPIGQLQVLSNDEAQPVYGGSDCGLSSCRETLAPVFGAAGVPSLRVVPESVVDFGYVAEGFAGIRKVTVLNVGASAVTVSEATIEDATTSEFAFVNPEDLPAKLNPGESVELTVSFTNESGSKGSEFARLTFKSTDPLVPSYALDVVARRAERPTCEPAFLPELLSLGAAKEGETLDGTLQIVNYGSGNCEYREYELSGCLKVQSGVRHRFDCQVPGFPSAFQVTSAPAYGTVIGPGEALNFDVRFTAPPVEDIQLGRDQHFGRLGALMHDPNINGFKYVAPPGGWMKGVNLRAESGIPKVVVTPKDVDYGMVRTDCQSGADLVTITNTGPVEATVTGVELVGCGDQVTLAGPTPPFSLPGFTSKYAELTMSPDSDGPVSCSARVTTDAYISNYDNAHEAIVPLSARGIDVAHKTDVFSQVPPPKVDVLFVIDDSMSMADEQKLLAETMPQLVQIAIDWGQDYHMAVTTTDTIGVRGTFQGVPAIATPETGPEDFYDNLIVGITGYWEERGLEGAWLALSGVNQIDSGIQCVDAPGQCPKYDDQHFLWCKEGICRGPNWGFLRDDAQLVIIIVSDEEDSSFQPVSWYVQQFAALKPKDSQVGVKLHAIVTTPEGCFGGYGSVGYRYIKAAQAFGGHVSSICATDFPAEFKAIGDDSFGLSDRFYPSLPADHSTLAVSVNGEICPEGAGWEWNANTRSVVFKKDGPCWPDYGDQITLDYDVLCQAPTLP